MSRGKLGLNSHTMRDIRKSYLLETTARLINVLDLKRMRAQPALCRATDFGLMLVEDVTNERCQLILSLLGQIE